MSAALHKISKELCLQPAQLKYWNILQAMHLMVIPCFSNNNFYHCCESEFDIWQRLQRKFIYVCILSRLRNSYRWSTKLIYVDSVNASFRAPRKCVFVPLMLAWKEYGAQEKTRVKVKKTASITQWRERKEKSLSLHQLPFQRRWPFSAFSSIHEVLFTFLQYRSRSWLAR